MALYLVHPCQAVGEQGKFSVAKTGGQPVFVDGKMCWNKTAAEIIAMRLNLAAARQDMAQQQLESKGAENVG